jgi:hypothetical protein
MSHASHVYREGNSMKVKRHHIYMMTKWQHGICGVCATLLINIENIFFSLSTSLYDNPIKDDGGLWLNIFED